MLRVNTRSIKSSACRISDFGTRTEVAVAEPDFASRATAFAGQRAMQIDHRGHAPPILSAAEYDHRRVVYKI
jgi:hypothetical protein